MCLQEVVRVRAESKRRTDRAKAEAIAAQSALATERFAAHLQRVELDRSQARSTSAVSIPQTLAASRPWLGYCPRGGNTVRLLLKTLASTLRADRASKLQELRRRLILSRV